MNKNRIQVFVVSQQTLFQQGIEHSLSDMEDMVVLGVAALDGEVLTAVDTMPPDVALVDIDGDDDIRLPHTG